MHSDWDEALACWKSRDFWQVHEHLEDLWKTSTGASKCNYQALLLSAVYFHHALGGNTAGARLCAQRAIPLLESCEDEFRGINMREFTRGFKMAVKRGLIEGVHDMEIPALLPRLELD